MAQGHLFSELAPVCPYVCGTYGGSQAREQRPPGYGTQRGVSENPESVPFVRHALAQRRRAGD